MMDLVRYRGPDDEGYALLWFGGREAVTGGSAGDLRGRPPTDARVALGHRRLAIIDLSPEAHQPMAYAGGRVWVAFNGEIYNFVELRRDLERRGYTFRSRSDTEVIPAAYLEWGLDCVQQFNGMFAIVLVDVAERRVVAWRDRLGIKPLYYRLADGVLEIGSEIKQLLVGQACPRVNAARLLDHLVFDVTDHHEETCVAGVSQLLPGHRLVVSFGEGGGGRVSVERYWEPRRDPAVERLSVEEAAARVRDLVTDAVRLRMRSDVPLGSCLSGGLDSSTVVCLVSRLRQEQGLDIVQHTFTYQPDDPAIDESGYADLVARICGAVRNVTGVTAEDLGAYLDRHLWHNDEPTGGLSHFARSRVMALVRRTGVTVVLDGQGGDELFLGYERYYVPAFLNMVKRRRVGTALREFILSTRRSAVRLPRMAAYAMMFGSARVRARVLERRARRWANPRLIDGDGMLETARRYHLGLDIWEMQKRELLSVQLPHLLRHEDRDSMAVSVEARVPLLDHRLVEFVMSLPPEHKIRNGWTKYCLRVGMEGILPAEIQWRRHKLGFNVPQERWVRAMDDAVRATLLGDLACEPFVCRDRLRAALEGGRLDARTVWRLYSAERFMRQFGLRA